MGLYWSADALLLGGGQEGGRKSVIKNLPYTFGIGRVVEL